MWKCNHIPKVYFYNVATIEDVLAKYNKQKNENK